MASVKHKCLCGHMEVFHSKKTGRCASQIKYVMAPVEEPEEAEYNLISYVKVPIKDWFRFAKEICGENKTTKIDKAMKRGYVIADCQCKVFHTIPIPDQDLALPDTPGFSVIGSTK